MTRACFVVVMGLAATLGAGQKTFRTATDAVLLPVTVLGRGNALVRGLTQADFEVFEDGKRQTLTFFSEGDAGAAVPLHRVTEVLDGSYDELPTLPKHRRNLDEQRRGI